MSSNKSDDDDESSEDIIEPLPQDNAYDSLDTSRDYDDAIPDSVPNHISMKPSLLHPNATSIRHSTKDLSISTKTVDNSALTNRPALPVPRAVSVNLSRRSFSSKSHIQSVRSDKNDYTVLPFPASIHSRVQSRRDSIHSSPRKSIRPSERRHSIETTQTEDNQDLSLPSQNEKGVNSAKISRYSWFTNTKKNKDENYSRPTSTKIDNLDENNLDDDYEINRNSATISQKYHSRRLSSSISQKSQQENNTEQVNDDDDDDDVNNNDHNEKKLSWISKLFLSIKDPWYFVFFNLICLLQTIPAVCYYVNFYQQEFYLPNSSGMTAVWGSTF